MPLPMGYRHSPRISNQNDQNKGASAPNRKADHSVSVFLQITAFCDHEQSTAPSLGRAPDPEGCDLKRDPREHPFQTPFSRNKHRHRSLKRWPQGFLGGPFDVSSGTSSNKPSRPENEHVVLPTSLICEVKSFLNKTSSLQKST